MNDKTPKPPWAEESSPLCDRIPERYADEEFGESAYHDAMRAARDLERRLRHALKLVGKLRADSECGDFDEDDLEQRLARIEETLTT